MAKNIYRELLTLFFFLRRFSIFVGTCINRFDVKNDYVTSLGPSLQSEKWLHGEKMSIFQSLLYFHHNVTTGKETSYQGYFEAKKVL